MNRENEHVVLTQMRSKPNIQWSDSPSKIQRTYNPKRLLRNISFSAAAVFVLGMAVIAMLQADETATSAMSQVTADFDYDETLGRLQFVSNILPESAMVFLESDEQSLGVFAPSDSFVSHAWSQEEPWIEYTDAGDVKACSDGEVMTIVKNRKNEFTIRLSHDHGYESIYSGLTDTHLKEADRITAGELIGATEGYTAFEMRKDGMSILPEFIAP